MPEAVQKLTMYEETNKAPKQIFHDLRDESCKERDQLGIPHTTLNKKLNLFSTKPRIALCENLEKMEPSIMHSEVLNHIMLIAGTTFRFYADKSPYNLKQKKSHFYSMWGIFSHDQRSLMEQNSDKLLYVGLAYSTGSCRIVKLQFDDDNCCQDEVGYSQYFQDNLFQC